jgi:hypothetical protein
MNDLPELSQRFGSGGFATFAVAAVASFMLLAVGVPFLLWMLRLAGVYTIVRERRCQVFVLFGKVIGILDEPGIHFLWSRLGWRALIVRWLGRVETVDLRLYQDYLRSQPVNSEEGAPMGIGVVSSGGDGGGVADKGMFRRGRTGRGWPLAKISRAGAGGGP